VLGALLDAGADRGSTQPGDLPRNRRRQPPSWRSQVALAHYDPVRDMATLAVVGENAFVSSQHWAAHSLWFAGHADAALERSDAAVRLARRPDHAFSLCHALEQAAELRQFRREPDQVRRLAGEMLTLAVEGGLPYRQATAGLLLGWAHGALGDPAAGCRELDASSPPIVVRAPRWICRTS